MREKTLVRDETHAKINPGKQHERSRCGEIEVWQCRKEWAVERHEGVKAVAEAFGYTPSNWRPCPLTPTWACPAATRRLRQPQARRGRCGPGMRWWAGRVPGGSEGRADRKGHRDRHDPGDARTGSAKCGKGRGRRTSSFTKRLIDSLPLPDGSVDCVISNCVINLAPDKHGRLSRNRPGAEAGRAVGCQRHRPEETLAARTRARTHGLRRLHRRCYSDRGVSAGFDRSRVCRGGRCGCGI